MSHKRDNLSPAMFGRLDRRARVMSSNDGALNRAACDARAASRRLPRDLWPIRLLMKTLGRWSHFVKFLTTSIIVVGACVATVASSDARPTRGTNYDGAWHLSFVTRSGPCEPSYEFDVNIADGLITHPNLVRFRGSVNRSGIVRASVTVQEKFAAGSGRLTKASGHGHWKGRSGQALCAGDWTAHKS